MRTAGSTLSADALSAEYGLSERLSEFLATVPATAFPDAVLHEAKRSVLNGIATAIAGAPDEVIGRSAGVLSRFGQGDVPLIARGARVDAATAAFLNAAATNVHDFDDTHPGTILHPTAPVAPTLYALAWLHPLSGADFLRAFVLGVETECRIANAISPEHYARGWHITSTCGVFGAAAAAGRVLGLSPETMRWAMGSAAAQAGGLVETLGTMAKSIGVGNSARNGLLAALYAQNGIVGPAFPLEGERGFLRVTGQNPRFEDVTRGLGQSWEMLRNTYKPYPCGVVLNPVIEAALDLAAAGIDTTRITAVSVAGHSLLRERTDRPNPASGREAQVSAQHATAVALLRGKAGLAEFSDAALADPEAAALRARVAVTVDPVLAVGAARITITLAGGETQVRLVEAARGDAARPLEDSDIEAKLRSIADHVLPGVDVSPVIDAVWGLESCADLRGFTELLRFGQSTD